MYADTPPIHSRMIRIKSLASYSRSTSTSLSIGSEKQSGPLMPNPIMSDTSAQLKSTVYLSVSKMVEEITKEIGVSASPSFTASLVELVYNQIISTGEDLELFATHAGRNVIQPSDVYMVTRRNEVLTKALKEVEETLKG